MIDVDQQISSEQRAVRPRTVEGREARSIVVARTYDTTVEDLWDACTNAERIPRWFLPVTGDLRVGGRYQLEGNAGGAIQTCDPPQSFTATWEYGEGMSWIEVRIAPDGDGARFELEHISMADDETWAQYGPGAAGIGWDLGLLGLTLHLASGEQVDSDEFMAWSTSPEGKRFMAGSSDAWCDAAIAAGAPEAEAKEAAQRVVAFYTGEA